MVLSAALDHGILNLPGITPGSQAKLRELLEEDYKEHHCFYGRGSLHNHLSHHLYAAYDLGASASALKAMYADEAKTLRPIALGKDASAPDAIKITRENWTKHLGDENAYVAYVEFFTAEVEAHGMVETFDRFVLAPSANANGAAMLVRLVAGAFHPMIQVGYGAEFGDERFVAAGLAQTAVHNFRFPELYADIFTSHPLTSSSTPSPSLLSLVQQYYDSKILEPVMPYDSEALISKRYVDAFTNSARIPEIVRIFSKWTVPTSPSSEVFAKKIEEVIWTAVLLLFGSSRPNRKPRLDFFIMHVVTSSLFIPTLFDKLIPKAENKAQLLQAYIRIVMATLIIRGRPRIDANLAMSYTEFPQPPKAGNVVAPDASALGDPRKAEDVNPWNAILASVVHDHDAHTIKTIRTLVYGSQHYGLTPKGGVPGAKDVAGVKQGVVGIEAVDGSLFVRAAGVVMDTLGWVSHGQKAGQWDRSALGWEDAWAGEDK